MDFLKPRDEARYQVAITFKADRTMIDALMPHREYKRMVRDFMHGKASGTYEFIMDGHTTELTFPLQEMDTIHAVPEIKDDDSKPGGDTSD